MQEKQESLEMRENQKLKVGNDISERQLSLSDDVIIDSLKWSSDGLIPCIVVDQRSKQVLMLAYMNSEALRQTLDTNVMTFYSRSRAELWVKGETSRNTQNLVRLSTDCDRDALIAYVTPKGPACHTGSISCFETHEDIYLSQENLSEVLSVDDSCSSPTFLYELESVIMDRYIERKEGSYTTYLFNSGMDKILKKIGEEASEVIIAAKNIEKGTEELISEVADLTYHVLTLLVQSGVSVSSVLEELKKRHKV